MMLILRKQPSLKKFKSPPPSRRAVSYSMVNGGPSLDGSSILHQCFWTSHFPVPRMLSWNDFLPPETSLSKLGNVRLAKHLTRVSSERVTAAWAQLPSRSVGKLPLSLRQRNLLTLFAASLRGRRDGRQSTALVRSPAFAEHTVRPICRSTLTKLLDRHLRRVFRD